MSSRLTKNDICFNDGVFYFFNGLIETLLQNMKPMAITNGVLSYIHLFVPQK